MSRPRFTDMRSFILQEAYRDVARGKQHYRVRFRWSGAGWEWVRS